MRRLILAITILAVAGLGLWEPSARAQEDSANRPVIAAYYYKVKWGYQD